jgi:acyl-CoA thioesterase
MDPMVRRKAFSEQVDMEPFAKKFGLSLLDIKDGYSKVKMRFTPDMENLFGKAHGGAIFALVDEAFEIASNSHGTIAVALTMSITYLSSPSTGSTLVAEAKEISKDVETAVYDIRVLDDQNRSIASGKGVVYRTGKQHSFIEGAMK